MIVSRDLTSHDKEGIGWLCKCDCGNFTTVKTKKLKSGNTKSCGCLSLERATKNIESWNYNNNENLVGKKFNKLTVIRLAHKEECEFRPKGKRYWFCLCDCGNNHIAGTSDLKTGKVSSCGCLNSKGEAKISEILIREKINFSKQISFNDLKSNNNVSYLFDFGVF